MKIRNLLKTQINRKSILNKNFDKDNKTVENNKKDSFKKNKTIKKEQDDIKKIKNGKYNIFRKYNGKISSESVPKFARPPNY